jgi:hypothetical protein
MGVSTSAIVPNTTTHLRFCTDSKNNYCFFQLCLYLFSHKCDCKGHQDVMWHHGFAITINMTTCLILGKYIIILNFY